jgi:hypothetical protein
VRIRDPWPDAEPDPRQPEPDPPDEVTYRVPARHTVAVAALAVALVLGAWVAGQKAGWVICGLAAAGLAGYAVRDLVAPVRLRADRQGVEIIHGYAGHRRLAWADIEGVRVDERVRFGREVQTLELDAGESLHIFSARDLGTAPADVAETLARLRA